MNGVALSLEQKVPIAIDYESKSMCEWCLGKDIQLRTATYQTVNDSMASIAIRPIAMYINKC